MASNPIRTKDTLPLNLIAWIDSYNTVANWPVERWLQFQRLEHGRLQDALVLLHDFQKEVNVVDATIQKRMLHWLDSAAVWNRESLSSWQEWDTLLKATLHWSLPIQAQVMAQHFQKAYNVSPENFGDISVIEDHFGCYWNQVQSRIAIQPDARWRHYDQHNQWETYNTFRRELKNKCLLDHSHNTRWVDFTRLSRIPDSWRTVLIPLYKSWLQDLPSSVRIANTNLQSWLGILESNNLDPSQMALPSFDSPTDYYCYNVPSSWENNTIENAFEKIVYMDNATRIYLNNSLNAQENTHLDYKEYPHGILSWMYTKFQQFSNEWSLERRIQLNDLFLLSLTYYGSEFMDKMRARDNLHDAFLNWMPEYTQQFTNLRESMDVLGIDYKESRSDWLGHVEHKYTRRSAEKEIIHYVTMLQQLLDPDVVESPQTMGHLFDSDDEFFGI